MKSINKSPSRFQIFVACSVCLMASLFVSVLSPTQGHADESFDKQMDAYLAKKKMSKSLVTLFKIISETNKTTIKLKKPKKRKIKLLNSSKTQLKFQLKEMPLKEKLTLQLQSLNSQISNVRSAQEEQTQWKRFSRNIQIRSN